MQQAQQAQRGTTLPTVAPEIYQAQRGTTLPPVAPEIYQISQPVTGADESPSPTHFVDTAIGVSWGMIFRNMQTIHQFFPTIQQVVPIMAELMDNLVNYRAIAADQRDRALALELRVKDLEECLESTKSALYHTQVQPQPYRFNTFSSGIRRLGSDYTPPESNLPAVRDGLCYPDSTFISKAKVPVSISDPESHVLGQDTNPRILPPISHLSNSNTVVSGPARSLSPAYDRSASHHTQETVVPPADPITGYKGSSEVPMAKGQQSLNDQLVLDRQNPVVSSEKIFGKGLSEDEIIAQQDLASTGLEVCSIYV